MGWKKAIALVGVLAGVWACHATTPPLNTNRTEVLDYFAENVYGRRPDLSSFKKTCSVFDRGLDAAHNALRKDIALNVMTPLGETNFTAVLMLPQTAEAKRVPCFVYIAFARPDDVLTMSPKRDVKPYRWPVSEIVAHGYATAAFYYRDVFPDKEEGIRAWGRLPDRSPTAWGGISVWALATSRVMDYLVTDPFVDASKVAVVGHSRLGKTALWAAATDWRFAYAVVNGSGCLGARVSTRNIADAEPREWSNRSINGGETIEYITRTFPHWFAPKCRTQFAGKDADLPFDQHWLIAAIAPRLVAVGSAENDHWACPSGEHAGLDLARPAWGAAQDCCHYHVRPGGHDLLVCDWRDYMDFAKKHGW